MRHGYARVVAEVARRHWFREGVDIMTTDPTDPRFVAEFSPEAWAGDQAIGVDPEGVTRWDATAGVAGMPESYRTRLLQEMGVGGDAVDRDDFLKEDPDAPEWVREWRGPFTIRVRSESL